MKNRTERTIAAVATPAGQGGISIIRMSGEDAERILDEIFYPAAGKTAFPLPSRMLTYGYLTDDNGDRLDECMAVIMRAPASYTREDVVEFQLHGGLYLTRTALQLCLAHGAVPAAPGEFTRRAFLNGRIDLSQAEAVMNLIAARGEQEQRAAMKMLRGGASGFIRQAADRLYQLQAGVAACMDYPDEISDAEGTEQLRSGLLQLIEFLESAVDEKSSRLVSDGMHVVFFGTPNVGKSSLLNALLGEEKAIVTDIPGTTRDPVEGEIFLNGVRICFTDTAGMRTAGDAVEKIGILRSENALQNADLSVLVMDGAAEMSAEDINLLQRDDFQGIVLINKSDLGERLTPEKIHSVRPELTCMTVSARIPETLEPFKKRIAELAETSDNIVLSQPRHILSVKRAIGHLKDALRTLEDYTPDMASVDLQQAQAALGEITGDNVSERLLDTVFSSFCVGK